MYAKYALSRPILGTWEPASDDYSCHCQDCRDLHVYKDDDISDDKLKLLPSRIVGFAHHSKRWGQFSVDRISSLNTEVDNFQSVILEDSSKNALKTKVGAFFRMLESEKSEKKRRVEDIVVSKTKSKFGLLMKGCWQSKPLPYII